MRNFENYIFAIILMACLWSCGHTSKVRPILDRAEMCMESHPDSAFVALDSLDRRLLDTPELRARHALLYSQALEKCGIEIYNDSIIHIALDYFDASVNRIAAWTLGYRNVQKALLFALLQPNDELKALQDGGNFTKLMVAQEELKTLPFGEVWDEYCRVCGKPLDGEWFSEVERYEKEVLEARK